MPTPTSVIEQFLHPPLAVLTEEIIPGETFGDGSLTRPRGPVAVDAFGITFTFVDIPVGFGRELGAVDMWIPRMVQISVVHTLLSGTTVVSEVQDFHTDQMPFLWELALPTRIDYSLAPGVGVLFRWLLAL